MRRYSGEPVAAGCAREVYYFLVPFHNSALDDDSRPVMTQAAHANCCMPRGGRPQSQPLADARLCRQDRHSRQVQCRRAVPNRIDLNQISFSRTRSSFRDARLFTLCNRCHVGRSHAGTNANVHISLLGSTLTVLPTEPLTAPLGEGAALSRDSLRKRKHRKTTGYPPLIPDSAEAGTDRCAPYHFGFCGAPTTHP